MLVSLHGYIQALKMNESMDVQNVGPNKLADGKSLKAEDMGNILQEFCSG